MLYALCMDNAELVRVLRASLGPKESQKRLAERFGVSQATVSRWEAGIEPVSGPAKILLDQLVAEHIKP
jgi:DNA-binding transcriptional regulator YiaG